MSPPAEGMARALEAALDELELLREQLLLLEGDLETARTRCVELFDLSPVALLAIDRRGMIAAVNARAVQMFGRDERRLVGQAFSMIFKGREGRRPPLSSDATVEVCDAFLDRGETMVRVLSRTTGHDRTYCALVDITELDGARTAVRESDARWRTVIDCAPSALLGTDAKGCIELANRAALELFACPSEWLIGARVVDLVQCVPLRDYFVRELPPPPAACPGIAHTRLGRMVPVEVVVRAYLRGDEPRCVIVMQDVQERQRLQREVLEMGEAERRRLGRDLHDGLGQQMAGLSMLLRTLQRRVSAGDMETARLADRAVSIVNDVVVQTRSLARAMYPIELESKGLVSALRALATQVEESSGLRVQVRVSEKVPLEIDLDTASQLFRLVQEALSNAVRHSGGQSVLVRLQCDAQQVEVAVIDDGGGLPPPAERRDGMGLRLMAERAALVGGHLTVGAGRSGGRGTTVRCLLPRRPAIG